MYRITRKITRGLLLTRFVEKGGLSWDGRMESGDSGGNMTDGNNNVGMATEYLGLAIVAAGGRRHRLVPTQCFMYSNDDIKPRQYRPGHT